MRFFSSKNKQAVSLSIDEKAARNFCIWIVKTPSFTHSDMVFAELARGLQDAFKALGYDAPIVTDASQVRDWALVICPQFLPQLSGPLPKKLILFNLEQVQQDSHWFTPEYLELLKRYPVWDYSLRNIQELKKLGVDDVKHCGIGYMPVLTQISDQPKDIDVLFYGSMNPRRQTILDQLTAAGANVVAAISYGKERDQLIARAKIVLNIHYFDAKVFEIVRVSHLLSNHACVVSESGLDEGLEKPLRKGVAFVPYEKLVATCLKLLKSEDDRKKLAKSGFEAFSRLSQTALLKAALEATPLEQIEASLRPRIFVQIASYRDPECQWTIKDMFEKATHPERVFAGICWQYIQEEDARCFEVPAPRPENVRISHHDAREARGACWARSITQTLWQGEEYTLQIDSHMRFRKGWDEEMLAMLAQCDSPKPIITTYPVGYEPPNTIHKDCLTYMVAESCNLDFEIVKFRGVDLYSEPEKPIKGAFCAAGYFFASSEVIREIPYDPVLYFHGEEITLAARLYTHGWDVYHPNKSLIYHYYVREERKHHSLDNLGWAHIKDVANKRVKHLLGIELSQDPEVLKDIERYSMGTVRNLQQFQKYCGVDIVAGIISDNAKKGIFYEYAEYNFGVGDIDDSWRQWVAFNLQNGLPPETVLNTVIKSGYSLYSAKEVMGDAFPHKAPVIQEYYRVLEAGTMPIPDGLKHIILEKYFAGETYHALHTMLLDRGYSPKVIQRELATLFVNPHSQQARADTMKLQRREGLMKTLDRYMRKDLRYLDASKKPLPPFADFLRDHYYANRMGVFTGAVGHWPASQWTPRALLDKVGADTMVEIQFNRETDAEYEIKKHEFRKQVRFADFIEMLERGDSNNFYLTAYNTAFALPGLNNLLADISNIGDGYLDTSRTQSQSFLWVGPKGTVTPLHHDLTNNFFVQLYGKKTFVLIPSMQAPYVANERFVFCKVDPLNPDYDQYPEYRDATPITVEVNAGECLFIPIGWLHYVAGDSTSISVSFTNFATDNGENGYVSFSKD